MNKTQTPLIRVKGFTDPWEQRKAGDIAEIIAGGTPSTAHIEYWEPKQVPWLSSGEVHKKRIHYTDDMISETGMNNSSAKWIPKNSVLIALAGQGKTRGTVAINRIPLTTNQSIAAMIFKKDIVPEFIFSNLESRYDELRLISSADGSRGGLNKQLISDLLIPIASKEEQAAIGCYFENLDNLITLHQRKYNMLVNIKKSMLSKMFPQNGKRVPEIRFDGFTDPWEQRKLGDLVTIERGGSPRPIDDFITDSPNGLNWVKIGDAPVQGNYITKTAEKIRPEGLSKTREVHPGDLILSNSMSFGKPYIMGIDGCIHDGWLAIRNTQDKFDLKFLCVLLGTTQMLAQYKAMAAGSTVNNLNKELVGNTTVTFPNLQEQSVIGLFFEQIEDLITLHQRKLEKMKNMKRSLLAKMFVN